MLKKYSLVAIAILYTSIGFSGCGSSTSSDNGIAKHMTQVETDPVKHIGKEIRELGSKDFDSQMIDWDFDNMEGLKIYCDQTDLYLQFTHDSNEPNIQFFIDIDDNLDTGNKDERGADYLIENGYLYKSLDRNSWKWKLVTKVDSHIKDGISDTIKIKLVDLENKNTSFKVDSQAINNSWVPTKKSPLDGTKSTYGKKTNIKWEDIPVHGSSGTSTVKVFDTKDTIYVHFEEDKYADHTQIFIDTDNNKDSGYLSKKWDNFGRDFLIEDGYLYKYTGSGNWGWEFVDFINRQKSEGSRAIFDFSIPKNKLSSLSNKIKLGIGTSTKEWVTTKWLPDNSQTEYELKHITSSTGKLEISEVMASNTHTVLDPDFYNFSDYIELHNPKNSQVDISGYKLSDKLNDAKWTIPAGTTIPANGYLTIWADEEDTKLHTNFKLKSEGEAVALFDRGGKVVDSFEFLEQLSDISVRSLDGNVVYMNPTPNSANSKTFTGAIASKKAIFSLDSGTFTDAQTLTLEADGDIYYTTDGSIPTLASTKYTDANPISINESMSVRAIASEDGKFVSNVKTNSYLVGNDANIDLPVMYLSIDDKYLTDETFGMYVIGDNGKPLVECGVEAISANYMQDWERPAHITMFENDKSIAFSQQIGLEVAGQCSRYYGQKSFKLKANDKYGKDEIKYKIFSDKDITKFKKLKLRASGQDVYKSHIRDALTHTIVKNGELGNYEAYRPSVLFVNGIYWGIYNLREQKGKGYIKNNFGIKSKKVDLLSGSGSTPKLGDNKDYKELVKFIEENSLSEQVNYDKVANEIDIENYIDYMATNIYIGNSDWPGTNLFYFKEKKNGQKWQWLFHDTDFGFGIYDLLTIDEIGDLNTTVNFNTLEFARTAVADDREWPNPDWSTLIFRKLLENNGFKNQFKTRFETLLNTAFKKQRVIGFIDAMASKIEPQIDRHNLKWLQDDEGNDLTKAKWEQEIQILKDYANQRPAIIRTQLEALGKHQE